MVAEIFLPQIGYIPQVFTNDRMLMFINALKQVSACIAHITCITQMTFVFINNSLFVNKRSFGFCHLISSAIFLLVNTGRKSLLIFFVSQKAVFVLSQLVDDFKG